MSGISSVRNDSITPIVVKWEDHNGILAFENRRMLVVCQTSLEDGRFSECVYIIKKLVTYRSDKEGT